MDGRITGFSGDGKVHVAASPMQYGGLNADVSFEDYQACDAINASGLKSILRSPMHYLYERLNPKADTPAMRFGRIVHMAILEPRRFEELKAVRPEWWNPRTNLGKEDIARWREALPQGAVELSAEEYESVQNMLQACASHPRLSKLLQTGKSEVSLLWHDEEHGVDCKARYDFVADNTNVIVDLKTTTDARADAFSRDMVRLHYGLSAFHYLEGARATGVARSDEFVWAVIEKDMPHGIALYTIDIQEIERSKAFWHKAMMDYARCKRLNQWPGYPTTFSVLETPPWAPKTIEYMSRESQG